MDVSRGRLVARRAGGLAAPPDGRRAELGAPDPVCGSVSTRSTADTAGEGHAGGLDS